MADAPVGDCPYGILSLWERRPRRECSRDQVTHSSSVFYNCRSVCKPDRLEYCTRLSSASSNTRALRRP